MGQAGFFNNLDGALSKLDAAKKANIISAQQEEDHINKMLSMYDAVNAKKAAGREWDLKTQSVWGNLKRFGKEMAEEAQSLKKAKKSLKKTEDDIVNMGKVANELEKRGNKEAADLVKKKKAQLEIEKEIQDVNYQTAKSSVSKMGQAFNMFGKVGGFISSNFGGLGSIISGILGTVFNLGIQLLKIIFPIEKAWKLFLEMQKVVGALAADIGLTYNEYSKLMLDMPTIYNEIVGYGGKIEDIGKIIKGFSEDTGKNRIFSAQEITDIVKLGYSTGLAVEGATKMVAEFDNLGYSLQTTLKVAQKGRNDAARFNINQTKLLQTTTDVVKSLTGSGFGRSVEGLTKLAAKAESLRFNLAESIKSFKDAFFSPEKAVEAAAKIQVLGGEFAQMFGDPFQLMYDSMNNADGMAEKLINSAKGLAIKNKNGDFIIPPAQRQILKEVAESLGQNYDSIVNAGIEQAKTADKMNALSKSTGSLVGISDDDQQALANLMTINKNGQYEIKMPNGVSQLVSSITSQDQLKNILSQRKASETAAEARLTLQDRLNIVLDRFAIGLTPLFTNLAKFLEDEGTLKKIEELGKGIADGLIPFIDDLFKPGGVLSTGLKDFLAKFNEFIDHIRGIMNGDGTFFQKIGKIFGEMATFVMKTILPYTQFIFGNIFKTMGDVLNVDLLKDAGEQLISKSFVTDGKRNEALIAMGGGDETVKQQMVRGNQARADANDTGGFTYGGYAAAGAATGAAIGSIFPVVGTAVGALVGGAAGLLTAGIQDIFETDDQYVEQYKLPAAQTTSQVNQPPAQPVKDALLYSDGRVFKGGKGDAVAFLDEMAFGQASKNSFGGNNSSVITVNVSGTIEHETENGIVKINAKEFYDSDPVMMGEWIKRTMSQNGNGSANYIVDFGVAPI
jgi:hypothetical protein